VKANLEDIMVKLNGFRLQSGLRDLELKKQAAESEFQDSLHFFANESKTSPEKLMEVYVDAERKLSHLQEIQSRYNLKVEVSVRLNEKNTLKMSLQHAIKLVGGAARAEKLWREATNGKKSVRSYYHKDDSTVRSKDNEYAQPAMTPSQIASQIRDASRFVSALREAIQVGNSTNVELDIPANLLE